MTEFDGNVPRAEQLNLRERLLRFGHEVLRALARDTQAFTGELDYDQYVASGVETAQDFVNNHHD